MIYTDVHTFLVDKASSKEIDIILNMIKNVDWDNVLRIGIKDLAKRSGTTEKYVKEVINKFKSLHKGKRIITENPYSNEFPYKLLIGNSSVFYNNEHYAKKYSFLYTERFKSLNTYEKRIILKAIMDISVTGNECTFLKVSDFIYRDDFGAGLIPNKRELIKSIEGIENKFGGEIEVRYVTNTLTKKEMLQVNIEERLLNKSEENFTERFILRKVLFENGYTSYLEDEYCIELEKIGKYVYNYVIKIGKDFKHVMDDLLYLARDIYTRATERLSKVLHKLFKKGNGKKEISAYFSSIVFSLMVEELAKVDNQIKSIETLEEKMQINDNLGDVRKRRSIKTVIQRWSEKWVRSRIKKRKDGDLIRKVDAEEYKKKNNKLKDYIIAVFREVEEKVKRYSNYKVKDDINAVSTIKEQIGDFIDIGNSRMSLI